MTEFLLSVGVFLLAHIIPPMPKVRNNLIAIMGRRTYLIAYSILSIALLTWMILAGQRADYIGLWPSAEWQWWVTIISMPFALWLILAGLFEPNPLSISLRKKQLDAPLSLSAAVTRHPVLWGFLIWALAHLFPNGDVVSLVLFGGMALLAIGGFFIVDKRTKRRTGEQQWDELAKRTSVVPFAAILKGRAKPKITARSVLWIVISLALYFWILFSLHADYLGADPLAGIGY